MSQFTPPHSQVSSVQIFYSSNYGIFRLISANRIVDENKIKRIRQHIMAGVDVLRYCPILVVWNGEMLEILDGQHRYWVAKELQRPVHFIVAEKGMDMYAIATMNSNSSGWKAADYIYCYSQLKNENYIKLEKFQETYKLPLTVSLYLLANGKVNSDGGYSRGKEFERGKFEIKYEAEAQAFAEFVCQFSFFDHYRNRNFIVALSKVQQAGKVKLSEFAEKIFKYKEELARQSGYREYLTALETIYNKNNQHRRPIW